jgi:hypothetical protein
MISYFVVSIINSMAHQELAKQYEQQLLELHTRQAKTKRTKSE